MPETITRPEYPDDGIDMRELLLALWGAKGLVALITVVVLAVAAAYAFPWPPTYEADARLLPPTQSDLANYNMAFKLLGPALMAAGNAGKEEKDGSPSGDPSVSTAVTELSTKDAYAVFLLQL